MARTMQSDSSLRDLVLLELQSDQTLAATGLNVEVENGVVTLSGQVQTYAEQHAAEQAVFRVAGVRGVADEIHVAFNSQPAGGDAAIARAASWTLEWDLGVPPDRFQCSVSDGWVTLNGTVERWAEREEAERAILHLPGVRGLVNAVQVTEPPLRAPAIREAIVEALQRHALRAAQRISVAVRDDRVVLTGSVASCCERKVVVGAVRGTRGVRAVEDHLREEAAT